MDYQLTHSSAPQVQTPCLILPVYGDYQLTANGTLLDETEQTILSTTLKTGDLSQKIGQTLWVRYAAQRVLLVYVGDQPTLSRYDYLRVLTSAVQALLTTASTQAHFYLTDLIVEHADYAWQICQTVFAIDEGIYRFATCKTKDEPEWHLTEVSIFTPTEQKTETHALTQAMAMSTGKQWTKELANLPANICTPTYLAEQAQTLAEQFEHVSVEVLDEHQMAALGMNALLAVSQGSEQPAKLIVIYYQPPQVRSTQPYVLVGKGITFDAGGISLKPPKMMDEMKFDMCGAASVLGTLKAAATLQLPIRLIGVIAAAENLPSGKAVKPGDIVKTMAGLTVEVNNTDAEGRLVLCDALHYVKQFDPKVVIDVATLTGAVIVALGHHTTGIMGNNQALATALCHAGDQVHDSLWQLPLTQEYQTTLKSNFADLPNIATDAAAGSIIGGAFLSHFTQDYPWAHLDIAGTAWKSGQAKGATGRPVAVLTQYLIDQSQV
ncbi:MAG: leucyl aminopeptidase [Legionellales bacterium]|nr:leucyl aminopeptidase [Legionellales bacterium]